MADTSAQYGPWHRVLVGPSGRNETIRGHTRDEAISNAEHTWPHADIEYVGVDDAFVDDTGHAWAGDPDHDDTFDWWASDTPTDACLTGDDYVAVAEADR